MTDEGTAVAEQGSHEAKVFRAIAEQMEGLTIAELTVISVKQKLIVESDWTGKYQKRSRPGVQKQMDL